MNFNYFQRCSHECMKYIRPHSRSFIENGFGRRRLSTSVGPRRWYERQLESRPLVTKCITSGIIAGSGDALCQYILHKRNSNSNFPSSSERWFDVNRTCRFTFLGTFLIGGVLHFWYGALNVYVTGRNVSSIIKRTTLDQFFMAPVFIATFMSSMIVIENGKKTSSQKIKEKLEVDLFDTVKTNWFVWIPAQIANFGLVAPKYQVLFSNIIGLGWNTYLSYKANGENTKK